jgi:threonine dehydrogenase-like Zn-dependent dehydrogenase
MFREIEIRGSLGCGLQDFPKVLDLAARGKIDVKALVTHRFPLEETPDALKLLESGAPDLVRAVVVPGGVT